MKTIVLTASIIGATLSLKAQLKPISYSEGNQKLNGLITSNSGKKNPGVLILPAWKGIDEEAKNAAIALEKEGYIALVADIYGEGNTPKDNAAAAKQSSTYKQDYQLYQKRIAAGLETLKKSGADAQKIAVIGYCFGGTGALEAARGKLPVLGVVSIHGSLAKAADRPNGDIGIKMLIENPANDQGVKPEDLANLQKEMNEGKADWQLITYANSKHTFTDPKSPDYNEVMAKRAWQHTLMFLKETLK